MSVKSIAIDGPSSAGKSTLAKLLADELNYLYVDTGAIYRTVGLHVRRSGVDPGDEAAVAALLPGLEISIVYGDDRVQRMCLNGEDVTEEIRLHEISKAASQISAIPAVRAFLLDRQRDIARHHNVIMDGRDIGTVVLPGADVKLFLTAKAEDRARRRHTELCARGQDIPFETVLHDIQERDRVDMNRPHAPLRQAEDAILVDTTGNALTESFSLLLDTVKERLR